MLLYLRNVEGNKIKEEFIINTNNIKSIFRFEDVNNSGFEVYLMSGTVFNFNQIYYEGKFVYVYKMNQIYKLLTKLECKENEK